METKALCQTVKGFGCVYGNNIVSPQWLRENDKKEKNQGETNSSSPCAISTGDQIEDKRIIDAQQLSC